LILRGLCIVRPTDSYWLLVLNFALSSAKKSVRSIKKNYTQPQIKLQISIEVNVIGATNSKLTRKCRHSGPLNNTVKGNDNGMDKRIEKKWTVKNWDRFAEAIKRGVDRRGRKFITSEKKKKNIPIRKVKFATHILQRRLEREAARLNRDFILVLWKTFQYNNGPCGYWHGNQLSTLIKLQRKPTTRQILHD